MTERNDKYLWEILIINDGSKDATGAIGMNFQMKIKR